MSKGHTIFRHLDAKRTASDPTINSILDNKYQRIDDKIKEYEKQKQEIKQSSKIDSVKLVQINHLIYLTEQYKFDIKESYRIGEKFFNVELLQKAIRGISFYFKDKDRGDTKDYEFSSTLGLYHLIHNFNRN